MPKRNEAQSLFLRLSQEERQRVFDSLNSPQEKWIWEKFAELSDHEAIHAAFSQEFSKSGFYFYSARLRNHALLAINEKLSVSSKLFAHIESIRTLTRLGLWNQAERMSRQAIKKAEEVEDFSMVLLLVSEQREIWRKNRGNKRHREKIQEIEKVTREKASNLAKIDDLFIALIQLPRNESHSSIMESMYELKPMSVRAEIVHLQMKIHANRLNGLFPSVEDSLEVVRLCHQLKWDQESRLGSILARNLHALGAVYIDSGKPKKALEIIPQLEKVANAYPFERIRIWLLRLALHNQAGPEYYPEAKTFVESLPSQIRVDYFEERLISPLYYLIVVYYMLHGDFESAEKWATKLSMQSERLDLIGFGKWFSVFLQWLNSGEVPSPNEIDRVKAWLRRNLRSFRYEIRILNTVASSTGNRKETISNILAAIEKLSEDLLESKFQYFQFRTWAKAYLDERPFIEAAFED